MSISISSYCQEIRKGIFDHIDGLGKINEISRENLIGVFAKGENFNSLYYRLDSSMSYTKISTGCSGGSAVDSGSWDIRNDQFVILKSDEETLKYELLSFDKYLFFIPSSQRMTFISDLTSLRNRYRKFSPRIIDGVTYTLDHIVGEQMRDKYFGKIIED